MKSVITKYNGMDCLDLNIIKAIDGKVAEKERFFSGSYGFCFNHELLDKKLGRKITNARHNRYGFLENILGVENNQFVNMNISEKSFSKLETEKFTFVEPNEMLTIIDSKSENEVIIVEIGAYYCHWDKGYRKNPGKHACTIDGFSGNDLLINDNWYQKSNIKLPVEEFLEGVHRISILGEVKPRNICNKDLIVNTIEKNIDIKNRLFSFAKQIRDIDLMVEYEGCNCETIYESTLDSRLKHIIEGRLQYKSFIESLGLHELSRKLDIIVEKWFDIKMKFAYSFISALNKRDVGNRLKNIEELVCEVSLYEDQFVRALIEAVPILESV